MLNIYESCIIYSWTKCQLFFMHQSLMILEMDIFINPPFKKNKIKLSPRMLNVLLKDTQMVIDNVIHT